MAAARLRALRQVPRSFKGGRRGLQLWSRAKCCGRRLLLGPRRRSAHVPWQRENDSIFCSSVKHMFSSHTHFPLLHLGLLPKPLVPQLPPLDAILPLKSQYGDFIFWFQLPDCDSMNFIFCASCICEGDPGGKKDRRQASHWAFILNFEPCKSFLFQNTNF